MNTRTAHVWDCKIGDLAGVQLPDGADSPLRNAVSEAYIKLTGREPQFIFSGWGGQLTPGEKACVENTEPPTDWYLRYRAGEAIDAGKALLAVDPRHLKAFREMLCSLQSLMHGNAVNVMQGLIDEIDVHRPLGPDGVHGDRHTPTCGCEDKA